MPRLKSIFVYFTISFFAGIHAQSFDKYPQKDFIAPVQGGMEIIGTFCELRPNHFHGGLDIRTGGQIGRPIIAIADGYISRINISTTGYGKALYVTHKNGYTSVYAHLNDFPEKIKWYINKNHYMLEKFEMELHPAEDLLQVKQGEMIAYSGNTGGSQGPHLHFEIRETKSEAPVNPLLFGIKMNDYMPPGILSMFLYRKDSVEKIMNGHYSSITLPMYSTTTVKKGKKKKKVNVAIGRHYVAFGKYALAANLRDYAKSAGDNNGVNYIKIYRNDVLEFDCRIEKFLFSQMRMHNNYIDYKRQKQSGVKMHKFFADDGNTLNFFDQSPGNGWFDIMDTIPQHFRIEVSDVYGNKTEKKLTIIGSPSGKKVSEYFSYYKQTQLCKAAKENRIEVSPEFYVVLPANTLYSDYKVNYVKNYGHNYTIGNPLVPLDKRMELNFRLSPEQVKIASKFTIAGSDGRTYGGELKNGNWLQANVREFGTYYLVVDSVKPSITPVSLNRNGYFSFSISDNFSGIMDFDFFINDTWVLLNYESKSSLVYGTIPNKLESGTHNIRFEAYDNRGNKKVFTKSIYVK